MPDEVEQHQVRRFKLDDESDDESWCKVEVDSTNFRFQFQNEAAGKKLEDDAPMSADPLAAMGSSDW